MRKWIVVGLVLWLGSCKGGSRFGAKGAETWPEDLGGASRWASERCGQPAKPLQGVSEGGDPVATKGFAIDCEARKAQALLDRAHGPLRERGLYLFLAEQSFGIGGKPDTLGVLPTRDPYEVMAAMGTNAANYDKDTQALVAWLRVLEREQPFELTGVGYDFLSGRFTSPVKDPAGLAKRMYDFCPDIVDQGIGSVEALAEELRRKGTLYFWWD